MMERIKTRSSDGKLDAAHLIARIQDSYHSTHRRDLPRLCALASKIENRHADDPRTPRGLADVLQLCMTGMMAPHFLSTARRARPHSAASRETESVPRTA